MSFKQDKYRKKLHLDTHMLKTKGKEKVPKAAIAYDCCGQLHWQNSFQENNSQGCFHTSQRHPLPTRLNQTVSRKIKVESLTRMKWKRDSFWQKKNGPTALEIQEGMEKANGRQISKAERA